MYTYIHNHTHDNAYAHAHAHIHTLLSSFSTKLNRSVMDREVISLTVLKYPRIWTEKSHAL